LRWRFRFTTMLQAIQHAWREHNMRLSRQLALFQEVF
jgi:hypothetical protein